MPSSSPGNEEARAFLQHRVARFGFHAGAMFASFFVFRVVLALASGLPHLVVQASMGYHLAAALCFAALWVACRGKPRSWAYIRRVEAITLLSGAGFMEVMGLYIPLISNPPLVVAYALTFGMVSRSAYVPSSGRRTAVLGAVIGVPLVALTYYRHIGVDVSVWSAVEPSIAEQGQTSQSLALISAAWLVGWWTMTIVAATSNSMVIYGLRKQVEDIRQLGQYHLEEKLGEGGMGMVFRARHAMLRRDTAVKLLPIEKAGAKTISRFEREVRLTAKLTHPNTVRIYDYGRTSDGVFYYAMELIHGATLSEVVEVDGAQPDGRVVSILSQAAGALVEAHGVGLIHRDIKPANVMLHLLHRFGGIVDMAKVVDFGLVKELDAKSSLSRTGGNMITGTPLYMPPEAIASPESVDARSDIYALGAVGYYLLTGTHVFQGNTVIEVCSSHLKDTPESPSARLGAPIGEALEQLILDCLAKDPSDRPQSALDFQRRLEGCPITAPWSADRAREWWDELADALQIAREQAEKNRGGTTGPASTMSIRLARGQGRTSAST